MFDLPAIPLSRFELAFEAARLDQELTQKTMDEIVQQRLANLTDWQAAQNPALSRYKRSLSLVFSDAELEFGIRNDLLQVLPFSRRGAGAT
ncbi:MAG: hypothetical protein AAF582_04690 [Pseudomonadota bacterium]